MNVTPQITHPQVGSLLVIENASEALRIAQTKLKIIVTIQKPILVRKKRPNAITAINAIKKQNAGCITFCELRPNPIMKAVNRQSKANIFISEDLKT